MYFYSVLFLLNVMSIDEKIRLGLLALSVATAIVVGAHVGHLAIKPPFLDELGGSGGS